MSIRRRKTKIDMDDLLPEEVVESTDFTTTQELLNIVEDVKKQLTDAIGKFETLAKDLTERIELLESDFKQVARALQKAGQVSQGTTPAAPAASSGPPDTGGPPPQMGGGPKPPTMGGGPNPPKL